MYCSHAACLPHLPSSSRRAFRLRRSGSAPPFGVLRPLPLALTSRSARRLGDPISTVPPPLPVPPLPSPLVADEISDVPHMASSGSRLRCDVHAAALCLPGGLRRRLRVQSLFSINMDATE
ncbi:hypothetical protein OPV22_010962 [Ensete ventricosum]|uniref:Uncharacterized protein n=1 Tax=Ensete ventricosum TaxID=4639 RepID=A0A444DG05_ENSVE|nr:hypothetical protein OPV22_010962 [Ensete ventricosum]RRT70230.1 hypothetical protein B296_00035726 [Ensete ventricosum]RWV97059.1 hypothetical protein GW17_00040179 [Ensete ventricosum]